MDRATMKNGRAARMIVFRHEASTDWGRREGRKIELTPLKMIGFNQENPSPRSAPSMGVPVKNAKDWKKKPIPILMLRSSPQDQRVNFEWGPVHTHPICDTSLVSEA
jgi:hypothetical protein